MADQPLTVLLAFPGIDPSWAVPRIEGLDPRVRVVVSSYVDPHDFRVLREREPHSEALRDQAPPLDDDQRAAFGSADVAIALDVPFDLAAAAPRLRWIQNIGSGVGQYVSARLPEAGIVLTNAAGSGAVPIAEFVLARLLEHWKLLPRMAELQARHTWEGAYGHLVAGRTVAVVGLGAIGGEVARMARAFNLHVLGVRRSAQPGDTDDRVDELVGPAGLHDVLGRSDAVVLAATGSSDDASLFDAAAFAAMRPGGIFVNVARGSLVDEDALVGALRSGHLAAAALDVTREEPLPPDSPLWDEPNLRISPHSSTSIEGYMERVVELFCDNLRRYLDGDPLRNVVDLAAAGY